MSLRMSLKEFARRLRAMNRQGRPFVCEGSPLTCTAFIVGLNPTTAEFWKYWNDSYGFDKSAFLDDFREQRGNRARARNIIEKIVQCASPIRCLETNIYDVACRNSEDLRRLPKNTDVFRFLLETIKPTALILHGKTVHTEVGRILGVARFSTASFAPVVTNGRTIMVCAVPHFASRTGAWSSASGSVEALGSHLREVVNHPFAREQTSGVRNSFVNSHGVGVLVIARASHRADDHTFAQNSPANGDQAAQKHTATQNFSAPVSKAAKGLLVVAGYKRDTAYRNRVFCAGRRVRIARTNTDAPTLQLVKVAPESLHLNPAQWRVNNRGTRWLYIGGDSVAAPRTLLGNL